MALENKPQKVYSMEISSIRISMMKNAAIFNAKYQIGQIVRHRVYPFRGIVFDVDSEFSGTEEWLQSIPEKIRPQRQQPFYHLLAEAEHIDESYIAYVSEQNLMRDDSGKPVNHPDAPRLFLKQHDGVYVSRKDHTH